MIAEPPDDEQLEADLDAEAERELQELSKAMPTRVLEMRMLHAKGEIGGQYDGSKMPPLIAAVHLTGVASGLGQCCGQPLDDHGGFAETNDKRLWKCPE